MKNFFRKIIFLTVVFSSLFSCGKKGDLYLPSEVAKGSNQNTNPDENKMSGKN